MARHIPPAMMGALMAAMVLWMGHDALMSGAEVTIWAAALFVGAHAAALAVFAGLALLVPRLRHRLRAHRPGPAHAAAMVAGFSLTALTLHILVHEGIVSWT